jgi:hypothetical protein
MGRVGSSCGPGAGGVVAILLPWWFVLSGPLVERLAGCCWCVIVDFGSSRY